MTRLCRSDNFLGWVWSPPCRRWLYHRTSREVTTCEGIFSSTSHLTARKKFSKNKRSRSKTVSNVSPLLRRKNLIDNPGYDENALIISKRLGMPGRLAPVCLHPATVKLNFQYFNTWNVKIMFFSKSLLAAQYVCRWKNPTSSSAYVNQTRLLFATVDEMMTVSPHIQYVSLT